MGIRAEVDVDNAHMNKKIKAYKSSKVPYVVVVGKDEMENRTVAINIRELGQIKDIPLDDFVSMCTYLNDSKSLALVKSIEEIR